MKSLDKLTLQSKTSSAIKVNSDVNAYQNDYATISLYSESGYTSSYSSTNSNIFFGSLFDIPNTEIGITNSEGVQTNNITPDQQFILSYDMSSQVAEEIMQPSLLEAKNYFYAQGYSELDIQELLAADVDGPALDESSLVPAVMMLIAEEQNLSASKSFNIQSMFGYEAKASEIGTCAGDALGVSAIAGALAGGLGTSAGKALMKKAIRKVAGRTLGWVGAAIFVYEFGDCMDWW